MHRIITLIFAAILALPSLRADGLLWRITGADLPRPSYIFGSYHLAPESFIDSISGLRNAIAEADVIVGELPVDALDMSAQLPTLMAHVIAPADSTLSKVLSAEQLATVDSVLAIYAGPPDLTHAFDRFKPCMISVTLQMLQSASFNPQNPLAAFDAAVMTQPEAEGKPYIGLETIDAQLEILIAGSIADQARTLLDAIDRHEETLDISRRILDAYFTQDLDALTQIIVDQSYSDDPKAVETLIYNRNTAWADSLPQMMRRDPLFVIVGAGHLGSERGLLNLLRQKGYTVTEVR